MTKQIREGISQVNSAKESKVKFGLVIDGKSLDFALDKKLEKMFLDLAIDCASVICCRSSPKQKALVSLMVGVDWIGKTVTEIVSIFCYWHQNNLIEF